MREYRTLILSLDEDDQYDVPTARGRSFRVKQVYVTKSKGVIGHIAESGPLLLLRGGVSVDDYGCSRYPKLEDLPETIRKAVERL